MKNKLNNIKKIIQIVLLPGKVHSFKWTNILEIVLFWF